MYNIEKEPAYLLYKFTIYLYENRNESFLKGFDEQVVYRTIINRAYYSAYSMAESWLFNKCKIEIHDPDYFRLRCEDIVSVHTQVMRHLKKLNMRPISSKMYSLKKFTC